MKTHRYICEDCNYSWGIQENDIYDEDDEVMNNDDPLNTDKYSEDLHKYAESLEEIEKFEEIQNCPMCGGINIHEL